MTLQNSFNNAKKRVFLKLRQNSNKKIINKRNYRYKLEQNQLIIYQKIKKVLKFRIKQ